MHLIATCVTNNIVGTCISTLSLYSQTIISVLAPPTNSWTFTLYLSILWAVCVWSPHKSNVCLSNVRVVCVCLLCAVCVYMCVMCAYVICVYMCVMCVYVCYVCICVLCVYMCVVCAYVCCVYMCDMCVWQKRG